MWRTDRQTHRRTDGRAIAYSALSICCRALKSARIGCNLRKAAKVGSHDVIEQSTSTWPFDSPYAISYKCSIATALLYLQPFSRYSAPTDVTERNNAQNFWNWANARVVITLPVWSDVVSILEHTYNKRWPGVCVACARCRHVTVCRKLVDAQHGARYYFRFRRKWFGLHVEEISLQRSVDVVRLRVIVVADCNDIMKLSNNICNVV